MTHSTTLTSPQEAHQTLARLWMWLKPRLMSGHAYRLTLEEPKRTLPQNARFHALCRDLELAKVDWAGKPRDAEQWKVLLVSAHSKATGGAVEIVPGLEGEFVNLRESTSRMDKARMSSLLEYAEAFAATHLNREAHQISPMPL